MDHAAPKPMITRTRSTRNFRKSPKSILKNIVMYGNQVCDISKPRIVRIHKRSTAYAWKMDADNVVATA